MFARNIQTKGRIVRALIAIALLGATVFTFNTSRSLAVILGLFGAFTAFEALRGWCGLRACGIKTKF